MGILARYGKDRIWRVMGQAAREHRELWPLFTIMSATGLVAVVSVYFAIAKSNLLWIDRRKAHPIRDYERGDQKFEEKRRYKVISHEPVKCCSQCKHSTYRKKLWSRPEWPEIPELEKLHKEMDAKTSEVKHESAGH